MARPAGRVLAKSAAIWQRLTRMTTAGLSTLSFATSLCHGSNFRSASEVNGPDAMQMLNDDSAASALMAVVGCKGGS